MTLQDEHKPVDMAIWNATLAALPDDCDAARLTVDALLGDDGTLEMGHSIDLLDRATAICTPTDEIYRLTREHYKVFERYGKPWRRVDFTVRYDFDAETWRCSTDFHY